MKQLTLSLLILFSSCVFADTYYCTQVTWALINELANEREKLSLWNRNKEISNEIFKLEINRKSKRAKFNQLNESGNSYKIIDYYENENEKRGYFVGVASGVAAVGTILFDDYKKDNIRTELTITTTGGWKSFSSIKKYKCSKEEKY